MNNDKFINKLLEGTRANELKWKLSSNINNFTYQPYEIEKNETTLLLYRYDTSDFDDWGNEIVVVNYALNVCNRNGQILTKILDGELKNETEMVRLFRLVERQVNNVDEILSSFFDD